MPQIKAQFRQGRDGQAAFVITPVGSDLAVSEVSALRLMRGADKKSINNEGKWIEQPHDLKLSVSAEGRSLVFALSAQIVNSMDAENYSVTVVCTSGDTAQTNIRINQIRAQKARVTQ